MDSAHYPVSFPPVYVPAVRPETPTGHFLGKDGRYHVLYSFIGDDGEYHPPGSFKGADGKYHPRGCFRGKDGKYHYPGSFLADDGNYYIEEAVRRSGAYVVPEALKDRQRRNLEGVDC